MVSLPEARTRRVEARPASQRGQSVIEGVLVLVVLIGMILGVLDFGQMMFLHQTLTERARAAARHAALNPADVDGVRNLVLFGNTVAPGDATRGFWGMTAAMVQVARNNQNTNEDEMVVTISGYRFQIFSPWIAGSALGRPIVAAAPVEVLL
jgi:Flp pilus assembly protein TadG